MKTGKRILSIFLAVLMLLTAAPLAGFVGLEIAPKAKALDATGSCGTNVTWSFNSSNGALTISGTGTMTDYTGMVIGLSDWTFSPFDNCSTIKSVVINRGVTSIGAHAFSECSSLTSVTIPDSVTSIGKSAFSFCSSLTSVTIPNSVTSIGDNAFYYCSSLTSVTIPNSVTSLGKWAFSSCSSLTSVTIGNSVTSIGFNAFLDCSSLTSIVIPDSVTSIGQQAFFGCSSLTSVTIGNSVTSIGEWTFDSCSSLTSVTIPNSVTSIGYRAFFDCSSLTSVTIPASVISIGDSAFGDCNSLSEINYQGTEEQWLSLVGYNSSLANVNIHYNYNLVPSAGICLADLECTDEGHYTGNQGDARIYKLDGTEFSGVSPKGYNNATSRNGNVSVNGTVLENGFEAWLARWNYTNEISFAYRVFRLNSAYKRLTGKTDLIKSYNTNSFDCTVYFYNGNTLLQSVNLISSNYQTTFSVDVSNVNELKVLVQDNASAKGGTSIALYDLFLDKPSIPQDAATFNGHSYKLFDEGKSWTEAKAYCEEIGGHLATITSAEEQTFITGLLNQCKKNSYWIGGERINNSFVWITGENWVYSNWGEKLPDNWGNKDENKLMIFGKYRSTGRNVGNWNDLNEDGTCNNEAFFGLDNFGFICEWEDAVLTSVAGTFESYYITVILNGDDSWITATIDGKEYKINKEVISTSADAEGYVSKRVVASLKNNEIVGLTIDEETNINKATWYDDSSCAVNYGVVTYQPTRASQVLEATSAFISAMQDYISLLGNEAGNAEAVDVDGIVKELQKNKQAYFSLTADAPKDAVTAAYYGIAQFIVEVASRNQLYLEINPKKSATEQAVSLVNSISRSIFSSSETYYHGKYSITIDALLTGQAYTGQICVAKKGNNSDSYIGPIVSSTQRTLEVITAYINNLSNIVKDECKYALASIYKEFMTVTGLAEAEEAALNRFFSDKVDILIKKGYGNVLSMFQKIRTGYNTVKKLKAFTTGMGDAETFLSYNNYGNAQWMYGQLKNIDYSKEGVKKSAVKKAISLVDSAKKDLADKLFNYLYDVDTGDPANDSFWDKTNSWFCSAWKCITLQCPVEFEIYDSNGNIIGYVDSSEKHDRYIFHSNDIHITVKGDVKYIYYPAKNEITIKLVAIDDGQMNYSIEEFNNGIPTGKINIYNVPLTCGEIYEQTIPANCGLVEHVETLSLSTAEETIRGLYSSANDSNAHVKVECLSSVGGYVIGDGDYSIGSCVKLMAFEDSEDKEFQGWYLNGSCVSEDEIYQFTAKENVKLTALFRTKHIHLYAYSVTEPSSCTDYGETVYTCDCGDIYKRIIEPKGHNWSEWIVLTQATCAAEGLKRRVCSNDSSHTETQRISALGHAYVNHNAKAPTCTEKGWDAYQTCTRCDYTTYAEKAVLGHIDKNNDGKCDRCKQQMTDDDVCPYCGKVHKGFFQKIIGFFHKIIYKLTHLFKKDSADAKAK